MATNVATCKKQEATSEKCGHNPCGGKCKNVATMWPHGGGTDVATSGRIWPYLARKMAIWPDVATFVATLRKTSAHIGKMWPDVDRKCGQNVATFGNDVAQAKIDVARNVARCGHIVARCGPMWPHRAHSDKMWTYFSDVATFAFFHQMWPHFGTMWPT